MKRLSRHLVATYLSFDPRSLGLFRIVFGLVMLADLLRRYLGVEYWYTQDGIVPTSMVNQGAWLYRLSIFNLAETHAEAVALMALCGVIFGLFTVGYKTRWFHFLSLVCIVSLNNRIFMLENGGQYVLNLLCTWTLFLPLGRRFSVDALLASLRSRRERMPEELIDRAAMRTVDRPVVSLAVLALLMQFAVIYFFNVVQKSGQAWRDGSAVHFALWWDQLITIVGLWMRELLPYPVTEFLTYGTLVVESAAVVLLLSPLWPRKCRLLAIALLPALHVVFNLALSLGIFSLAMISFYALLPSAADWEWLERVRRGRGRKKVAFFDADCGICFMFARVFARLDPRGRVRFVSNREGSLPPGITSGIAERAIIVEDEESGEITIGSPGMAELMGTLTLGRVWSLPLRVPGLSLLSRLVYNAVARNRTAISRRLGLAACGTRAEVRTETPAPLRRPLRMRFPRIVLREAAIVVLIVAAVGDLQASNVAWPESLRYRQPAFLDAVIWGPRLRQYWFMFCPEPPKSVQILTVEARTVDGRVVDPFNEVATRYPTIPPADARTPMPDFLGMNQFFCAYSGRVVQDDFTGYRPALARWIFRHHLRTGNPADKIVRFEAYRVTARSPPAGSDRKTQMKRTLLFAR